MFYIGFINDAFGYSDYTASNYSMISKQLIGNYAERSEWWPDLSAVPAFY
jgi:hypothetical protein